MIAKNYHISEYLKYYVELKESPGYAIMLRGRWGVGKSWFIKDSFKDALDKKCLYISLNGVSSSQEIEDIFFQKLHPILGSKGMKIAGKIMKGILKTSVNIDFNNDKSNDVNITSSVPEINLPTYFKNADDRILIFDDLERCIMPIQAILGYINEFVENNGLKVLILANESEIKDQISYLQIKEKIVGKSFDIEVDFDAAFEVFIENTESLAVKKICSDNKNVIKNCFDASTYSNLRHLRQSILDFNHFLSFLPSLSKNALIEHIISTFFAISFEIKRGELKEDKIEDLFAFSPPNDSAPINTIQIIKNKYVVFKELSNPIDKTSWKEYFKKGSLDKMKVKNSIENSWYFFDTITPAWRRLWHLYDLEDQNLLPLSTELFTKITTFEIEDKYILLHSYGILLQLIKDNLIDLDENILLKKCKECSTVLKDKGLLALDDHEFPDISSYGLGYTGKNFAEWESFKDFLISEMIAYENVRRKSKAYELLDTMKISTVNFIELITLNNYSENEYIDIPILSFIEIDDFKEGYLSLKNNQKKLLAFRLEKRYKHDDLNKKLAEELPWLRDLKATLSSIHSTAPKTISSYLFFKVFQPTLDKCIEMLENSLLVPK